MSLDPAAYNLLIRVLEYEIEREEEKLMHERREPVDGVHVHSFDTIRVVEVIENRMRVGKGVSSDDPVREVVQYWTMEGELLAEVDEWKAREGARAQWEERRGDER